MNSEEIARRAEELWREAGCPDGRSEEFWLRAEGEMKPEPHRFGHFKIPAEYHIRGKLELDDYRALAGIAMSANTLKKWQWTGAIIIPILSAWSGWALANTWVKAPLNSRIDKTEQAVQAAQEQIDKRAPLVDRFLLVEDSVKRIEEQSKENGRDLKDINSRLARMEGKFDKAQALAR